MTPQPPVVADVLLGTTSEIRFETRDADGDRVTPIEIVARVGLRGTEPVVVPAIVGDDGIATFTVRPTAAGQWLLQVEVTAPVEASAHGLIRVAEPAFGGLDVS